MRRFLLVLPLLLAGCVERILSVRSEPPGAEVWLDGERVGTTPAEIPYDWYGTRELTLERPGYRSITVSVELSPPWWQIFPLDFVTDLLLPFTVTDRTERHFLLQQERATGADAEELRQRAAELKGKLPP